MTNNTLDFSRNIVVTTSAVATISIIASHAFAQTSSVMPVLSIKFENSAYPSSQPEKPSSTQRSASGFDSNVPIDEAQRTDSESGESETPSAVQESPSITEAETIVVTGSHIRGASPAGAKIEVFTREDLERSGYATVQDFIHTLPQNFQGGGGSEDPAQGVLSGSNQLGGSAIDLRGLGADSTLILINGRRGPQSGLSGNFTDISLIPQSAVERIEILADGASALYGSDAVGGVVNFILRKDYDGAETRFRYGRTTEGNLDEYRLAQTFGQTWDGGNILISYEFYKRDPLTYGERDFASTLDLRPRGGEDRRTIFSNPGNILDITTFQPIYAIPRNQNGRSLTVNDLLAGQVNLTDRSPSQYLLPKQKKHSVFATAEHSLSNEITLFAEAHYGERKMRNVGERYFTVLMVPPTNPFYVNPLGNDPVWVAYSFEPELGLQTIRGSIKNAAITAGARIAFSSWRWESFASYSREKSRQRYKFLNSQALNAALADTNPETALNVFGEGAVNDPQVISGLLSELIRTPRYRVFNANSIIDGPLASWGNKTVSAALGADYRSERFRSPVEILGSTQAQDRYSRHIKSAFAELNIPLIVPEDENSTINTIELSIAGRYDDYSDVGSTTNPKVGIKYKPTSYLSINSTYGTSYRAPNLIELSQASNSNSLQTVPDPKSATQAAQAIILTGNNPNIKSEKAKTWTLGMAIDNLIMDGLSIGAQYFYTKFKDRINFPPNPTTLLELETLYPGLIIRNPSAEQLSEVCKPPVFLGNPAECTPGLIGAIIDGRSQNMAISIVRGIDASINYGGSIGAANVSFGLAATYLIDYLSQQSETSPRMEQVDTIENPVDFRSRAYASGSVDGLSGTITLNYTDSYLNNRSALQRKISSFTTIDLFIGVTLNEKLHLDKQGVYSLNFSVVNLFDNDPPFADNTFGYDPSSADPLGRLISIEAKIKW